MGSRQHGRGDGHDHRHAAFNGWSWSAYPDAAQLVFGFLVTALYVPGIYGAATTPRWALVAVVTPLLLLVSYRNPLPRGSFTSLHALGLSFLAWAALTLLWSANRLDGFDALTRLVVLAEVFLLGHRTENPRPMFVGIGLGIFLSSVIAIIQWWGWYDIVVTTSVGRPSGLYVNGNYLGSAAMLALVAACAMRIWWLVPGILPSIVLSQARGALISGAVVACVWLWRRSRLSVAVIVAIAAAVVIAPMLGGEHDKLPATTQRIQIWRDTLSALTLWGHGLGSFDTLYPFYAHGIDTLMERPTDAHNDYLTIAFETGIIGSILFVSIVLVGIRSAHPCALIFIAFAVECFFGDGLALPATAFVGAFCLGRIARDRPCLWDTVAARRMELQGRLRFALVRSKQGHPPHQRRGGL